MNARTAMRRHAKLTFTPKGELTEEDRRERAEAAYAYAIAQAVYDRRTALGITQTELARRTGGGMTQSAIAKTESGLRPPTVPTLLRLARAMESRLRMELAGEEAEVEFIPLGTRREPAGPGSETPARTTTRHHTIKGARKDSDRTDSAANADTEKAHAKKRSRRTRANA